MAANGVVHIAREVVGEHALRGLHVGDLTCQGQDMRILRYQLTLSRKPECSSLVSTGEVMRMAGQVGRPRVVTLVRTELIFD